MKDESISKERGRSRSLYAIEDLQNDKGVVVRQSKSSHIPVEKDNDNNVEHEQGIYV